MRFLLLSSLASAALASNNYSGPLRPQVHYSPPHGFMNDPNGLFFDRKGVYHLYYQWNPTEIVAGNQHWGHATSHDLYHWTNHPAAIAPSNPDEGIFSGSAVVDSDNTSGFFPDQDDGVVAIYTLHTPEAETQHIAYSKDGGYTYTKYADNPVIDSTSTDFRDPQVVWHREIQKWVMAVAFAADRIIGFYTSPNLKDWTHTSNFSQPEMPGKQVECPNLIKFSVDGSSEERHVLFISINPGAPLGGSATGYLVGHFNGSHFTSEDPFTLMDFGKDNYAAQWYSNIPDNRPPVSIAWASNWQYTEEVPTGSLERFRGVDSLPRVNTLQKVDGSWLVTSNPYNDLSTVKGQHLASHSTQSEDIAVDYSSVESNAISFSVEITQIPSSDPTGEVLFNFTSSTSNDFLDGGFHLDTREFWINRAGTHGFTTKDNPAFTPSFNTTVSQSNGPFTFSGVIDRSLLELFLNGGEQSATVSFFPTAPLDVLTVSPRSMGKGGAVHLDAWGLESSWDS